MMRKKAFINSLSKVQKIVCLLFLFSLIIILSVGAPTFARLKNRVSIINSNVWDGSIATSYSSGNGTELDPYIISDGSELAYFSYQLQTNDYENTYFKLNNNIKLNSGVFIYSSVDGIQYILNSTNYYVDEYTNNYFDNTDKIGTEIGKLNVFDSLNNFKGIFDGDSYSINGLYVTSSTEKELGLFVNLEGTVKNLYVENSLVYGGTISGGIASNATNATLINILYDGYVVGKGDNLSDTISYAPISPSINLNSVESYDVVDLTNTIPFMGSTIISTSITGTYTLYNSTEENTILKINGTTISGGSFNVGLGTNILDDITITSSTTSIESNPSVTFENLSYNIEYDYGASGGLVGSSTGLTITNSINKADVFGYSTSGGLVGVTNDSLSIVQSYNTGSISGDNIVGGLIGDIEKSENNVSITSSYNSGALDGSEYGCFVAMIESNNGTIAITNSFDSTAGDYALGKITDTTVNISNTYVVSPTAVVRLGTINGSFTYATETNLKTETYDITNIYFDSFVSLTDVETNVDNVWIYEDSMLPILYIDDISNPIGTININSYSWNNFSDSLDTIFLSQGTTFSIEDADELNPTEYKYYYISNSITPLTKSEVEAISSWTSYSETVSLDTTNNYVIYVKLVDYDESVTYINTDIIDLDLTYEDVTLSLDSNAWYEYINDLTYVHIDRAKTLTISVDQDLLVSSTEYYISSQIKTISELNLLLSWDTYSDGIDIDTTGTYIVYVKVTLTNNDVIYVNSDYIVYNGYSMDNIIVGRNSSSYIGESPNITDNSVITINEAYNNSSINYVTGYNHNLISNILYPVGTKITLVDNIYNKVYEYIINSSSDIYGYESSCGEDPECENLATYSFSLFKEIGKKLNDTYFSESFYYNVGTINEDFTIVLDFSNTNISSNYEGIKSYIELRNSLNDHIIPTLHSTIKTFNLYYLVNSESTDAELDLTTTYDYTPIILNSDSSVDINLTSKLNYKYLDTTKILDTTYENQKMGLLVKLVDAEDNDMDSEYLKNMLFIVGENSYQAGSDNYVRLIFNSSISDKTDTLRIQTYENNSNLEEGTYYLKIYNFISYDGMYSDVVNDTPITIPVTITSNYQGEYSFDVIMNYTNHILNKEESSVLSSFDILQNGDLENANIRVSLYEKDELTAYNQDYTIVDLKDYVSDILTQAGTNVYYVSQNPIIYDGLATSYNHFELNLLPTSFNYNGYKLVFELYDGDKKISTINEYFVVR